MQKLLDDVSDRLQAPAEAEALPRGLEDAEGLLLRNRIFLAWAGLVLVVALGITLALAIGSASWTPPPVQAKTAPEHRPEQVPEREDTRLLPVPSVQAGRPQPKSNVKDTRWDEPSSDAAKLFAGGAPAATQDFVQRWYAYLEWLLEIRLTEAQRRQCYQCWLQRWQETAPPMKERFSAYASLELQWWGEVSRLSAVERDELRGEKRLLFLARLRKSADPDDRMLLRLYLLAHEPGSERNPILVAGTPPLTQDMMDQGRWLIQWILDIRLNASQRQDYQRLFSASWKSWEPAVKDGYFKSNTQILLSLPLMSAYSRDLLRAQRQAQLLAELEGSSGDELAQLLLSVRVRAHRPGGERNPVLVPGRLPLTQDMVSQLGDFLEWTLDLEASGGLTPSQRQELQAMLIRSWEKGDDSWKTAFGQHLQTWRDILRISDAERARWREKHHPALIAQLRRTPTQLNRWLLELTRKEQNRP
jgi:hypothetical protein